MKKVSLSAPSDNALNEMLGEIKDGYKTGKISKQTLTNWIVLFFWQQHFEKTISRIRKDHEDPILVLRSQIKALESARRTNPNQ